MRERLPNVLQKEASLTGMERQQETEFERKGARPLREVRCGSCGFADRAPYTLRATSAAYA